MKWPAKWKPRFSLLSLLAGFFAFSGILGANLIAPIEEEIVHRTPTILKDVQNFGWPFTAVRVYVMGGYQFDIPNAYIDLVVLLGCPCLVVYLLEMFQARRAARP